MWRDPLEELIDTLETALPAISPNPHEVLPRLEDLQIVMSPFLFGTADAQARMEASPLYRKVMTQLAARAERPTKK